MRYYALEKDVYIFILFSKFMYSYMVYMFSTIFQVLPRILCPFYGMIVIELYINFWKTRKRRGNEKCVLENKLTNRCINSYIFKATLY